jgi:transcriptional regulator with XRE-family HTH domain
MLVIDCRAINIICLVLKYMTAAKIRKSFGNRVRKLRSTQNYSQEAFADHIELHRTYIGAIERGEQNVSLDNIAKIAKGLNISISELFKGV